MSSSIIHKKNKGSSPSFKFVKDITKVTGGTLLTITMLGSAIAAGGSTLRDFKAPDGTLGLFPKDYRVYGREGQACPCGGLVRRRVEAGRSTFYCARCQR